MKNLVLHKKLAALRFQIGTVTGFMFLAHAGLPDCLGTSFPFVNPELQIKTRILKFKSTKENKKRLSYPSGV